MTEVSSLWLELDRNDMSVDCVGVTACILVTVTAVRTPSVGPRLSLLVICRMFWWDRLKLHHAACCCRLHPAPATTFVCVWFLASPHHRYQAHGLNLGRYTFLPPVQSNCEIKMGALIELYNTDRSMRRYRWIFEWRRHRTLSIFPDWLSASVLSTELREISRSLLAS